MNSAVVSLDGTREIHDSIRGKGNFDNAMRGLKCLIEANIDVRVNSVIMKNNINEVIELAKTLNKMVLNYLFDNLYLLVVVRTLRIIL